MGSRSQRQMLEAGQRAPEFTLPALGGGTLGLHELVENGPAVLAFFNVSCPVCQLEFPFLDRLSRSGGMRFVAVSQDDAGATQAFLEEFGVTFPALMDEAPAGYPASNAFGITHVPSVFVVEQDGMISHAWSGFSKADLEQLGRRLSTEPFRPEENVPAFKPG